MSRARLAVGASALIRLDRAASESLGTQLIRGLRNAVLEGRLRAGHRLPPTRILASELGVSRNAVLYAFEQLVEEGHLRGRVGSGTYVREDLPETVVRAPVVESADPATRKTANWPRGAGARQGPEHVLKERPQDHSAISRWSPSARRVPLCALDALGGARLAAPSSGAR
jgi:GntR family transcriptional regulator / MocR family aminotransferase